MYLINKIKRRKIKILSFFFRLRFFKKSKKSKKIILFFIPSEINSISGGLLSICSIFNETLKLKSIHGSDCYTVYLPQYTSYNYRYKQFKNDLVLFNLKYIIKRYKQIEKLEIQLPEIFINSIIENNNKTEYFHSWIKKIGKENIKINILNQNDFLMSKNGISLLKNITNNITMTVAHEKYASIEKRIEYDVPLHLISPWLTPTPYFFKTFNEKENLILFSPDEIEHSIYKTPLKSIDIINHLKNILPNYEFKIIKNIKYDDYKNLISKAKFVFTFGEGLDGYFVEPYFSGSISFAVKNNVFFNEKYNDFNTIFDSYEELLEKIENVISELNNEATYNKRSKKIHEFFNTIYSLNKLNNNLKSYFVGDYDFK